MGAPPEVLARARATNAPRRPEFAVLPQNLEAVQVFWALTSQWRMATGLSGVFRIGLDYQAIPTVLRFMEIPRKRWGALFDALRVMELAVLESARS